MEKKIEFETFRDISSYEVGNLKRDKPSSINFLSYKKFKITIEPIEESNEVYIERLNNMLLVADGYNEKTRINAEIKRLEKLGDDPK